jgi:hypothetical protein
LQFGGVQVIPQIVPELPQKLYHVRHRNLDVRARR